MAELLPEVRCRGCGLTGGVVSIGPYTRLGLDYYCQICGISFKRRSKNN